MVRVLHLDDTQGYLDDARRELLATRGRTFAVPIELDSMLIENGRSPIKIKDAIKYNAIIVDFDWGGASGVNGLAFARALRDAGYQGALSIECEGQSGPMIEQSLTWLRQTLGELKIPF